MSFLSYDRRTSNQNSAFTPVELLTVIAIIGILAALMLATVTQAQTFIISMIYVSISELFTRYAQFY